MKLREIFYCNLIIEHKGNKYTIEKAVYKNTDGLYHNKRELKKHGISDPAKVLKVDIIKSLGFAN